MKSGWYLIAAKRCEHKIISDQVLGPASATCSIVACSISDTVMFASATLWRNGEKLWRVEHNGDEEVTDLRVMGQPPEDFEPVRAELAAKQAAEAPAAKHVVDWYFEIPLVLARKLTGFQHDEEDQPGIEPGVFEILRPDGSASAAWSKPWWRFW